jgi:cytochrome P450
MVRNKAAFTPFGTGTLYPISINSMYIRRLTRKKGSHTCLGRHLATDKMRLVIARIVTKYRFRLAPGGDRVEVDLKDQFAAKPGSLKVIFERREDVSNEKMGAEL